MVQFYNIDFNCTQIQLHGVEKTSIKLSLFSFFMSQNKKHSTQSPQNQSMVHDSLIVFIKLF